MPFDLKRYPKNWKQIRTRILERAANKCERCGVLNGAVGYREKNGAFVQFAQSIQDAGMEVETTSLCDGRKVIKIVLTIAHVGPTKHDKMDCRDEVLLALCQRCHLIEDIDEHTANAARTRALQKRNRAIANGQHLLLEAPCP